MKIRIYEEPVSIIREADANHGYEVDLPIDIVIRFRHSLTAFRQAQDVILDAYNEAVSADEENSVLPVDELVESLR